MLPPPLEGSDAEMGEAEEGGTHPQMQRDIDIHAHKAGLKFRMDYFE